MVQGREGNKINGNYLTGKTFPLGRAASLLSQDLFEIKPKTPLPWRERGRELIAMFIFVRVRDLT
jgi:hypothetical protein